MPVTVVCSQCGKELRYDSSTGYYHCDACNLAHRGPSKEQARGEGTFRGVRHPRR